MMRKKYYKAELVQEDVSQAMFIIATLEALHKLGWRLIHLSQYGVIAHTTVQGKGKPQEIIVRKEGNTLLVRSDNTSMDLLGRNNNQANVTDFMSVFNSILPHISDEYAFEILQSYPLHFAHPYHDILSPQRFSQIGKHDSILNLLKPVEGYFVTPLLLLSNILVFALMMIAGVDLMDPSARVMYDWGANFGPAVSDGEWWRLLSAAFLHIGIVHLLSNMIALGLIGFALEPILGKIRFLTAYLISGIAASMFSIYSHPGIISAGASGAIFGMYGVLIALLFTKVGEGKINSVALPIMSMYVLYQLAMGMKAGIDNAGHIGGLLGGLLIGFVMYPGLKSLRIKNGQHKVHTGFLAPPPNV